MPAAVATLSTVVALSANHPTADVDDDVVVLNALTDRYVALHGAGKHILQLLDAPRSVQEICEAMIARFDVSQEQCERDVIGFIEALIREEVITIVPDQGAPQK